MTAGLTSTASWPLLSAFLSFIHPPHCQRIPLFINNPYPWSWLWPIVLLQTYLLFNVPSSKNPLLANHARPIRLLLLIPETILCCHVAFAYRFQRPDEAVPPSWRIVGERDFDFVCGVMAAYCWAKSLEFAIAKERPMLDEGKRWDFNLGVEKKKKKEEGASGQTENTDKTNGAAKVNGSAMQLRKRKTDVPTIPDPQEVVSDAAHILYFPNTSIPLWLDVATNLRGLGWKWGIASPASGPAPVPATLRHPQTMRFLLSRLWTCLSLGTFLHFSHGVIVKPLYIAAYDHPAGSLASQPYASSWIATTFVQGVFTLLLGSMVLAPIQGVFSLLSIISVLVAPKTQYWWEPLPFNDPFQSTSLKELWGERWHALFRRAWYICGYRPAELLAQRAGVGKKGTRMVAVLNTFLMSGIFHEFGLHVMRTSTAGSAVTLAASLRGEVCPPLDSRSQGFGANSFSTTRFFLTQAVGLILESVLYPLIVRLFPSAAREKRRGWQWLAWIWVLVWCAVTGRGVVQTWIWHGFVDDVSTPAPTFLSGTLAGRFVALVVRAGDMVAGR
ncbi:hypothetical protein BCV69DRAFT_283810 [Microstroma glucosiphilum]|uniref:Wax synthase domain-containing protein n=1 Tax=Pseudomicrostroma glucosiphilum TaxID=1684307 RepID=A0A316U9M6_9BASI|nr:hypothetical protein BCV69DRAFT_283810 [Pseudomicrostroma glucosiphilum]PWN19705.1 hypothetical protein BCV69DRAFT_283810 [Pseudomicrostroma glucosiphilum]